jgi:hypothetical protein
MMTAKSEALAAQEDANGNTNTTDSSGRSK